MQLQLPTQVVPELRLRDHAAATSPGQHHT
eukprot:COSAG02_NODE_15296_length_1183_cov_3.702808_1_plen_29_part_10